MVSHFPLNVKFLDLSKVIIDPDAAPQLVSYLRRVKKLESLELVIGGEDYEYSDTFIKDIGDAISVLPVHTLAITGIRIGKSGRDSLVKYIKTAKSLVKFSSGFYESCRVNPMNDFLDALSTRKDIQTVTLGFERDPVDILKIQNFFEKTSRSLLHAFIWPSNSNRVDANSTLLVQALKNNDHLHLCNVGRNTMSKFNSEVVIANNRCLTYDYEKKIDLSTLIARLRCLSGSRYKKEAKTIIPPGIIMAILVQSLPSYRLGYWHEWTFNEITKCLLDRRTLGKIKYWSQIFLHMDDAKRLRCTDCDLYRSCQQALQKLE